MMKPFSLVAYGALFAVSIAALGACGSDDSTVRYRTPEPEQYQWFNKTAPDGSTWTCLAHGAHFQCEVN